MKLDNYRIKPTTIAKHRISRGLGGKNAVQYYTSWDEVAVKTWEHETDLEQYGTIVSRYWAGEPVQIEGENAKYGRYRAQLVKRMLACAKGERHVAKGFKVCCDVRGRPGIYSLDIFGSYIYTFQNHSRRLAAGKSGDGGGRCTELGSSTQDQAFRFRKEVQRSFV